jgi:hypothetical protein
MSNNVVWGLISGASALTGAYIAGSATTDSTRASGIAQMALGITGATLLLTASKEKENPENQKNVESAEPQPQITDPQLQGRLQPSPYLDYSVSR